MRSGPTANLTRFQRTFIFATIFGLLCLSLRLSANAQTATSDVAEITNLMTALSDHSKTPAAVLDPNLSPSDREKNLHFFRAPQYQLSLVPTQGEPVISGDTALVPVRVHFKGEEGNELDTSATIHFIKRNGTWYFSNFGFMSWPAFLIVVLVVCALVGISYSAGVLVLRNRLLRKGMLRGNMVRIFIPFFWPSLFRGIP
jgi:hypothetical protein